MRGTIKSLKKFKIYLFSVLSLVLNQIILAFAVIVIDLIARGYISKLGVG